MCEREREKQEEKKVRGRKNPQRKKKKIERYSSRLSCFVSLGDDFT